MKYVLTILACVAAALSVYTFVRVLLPQLFALQVRIHRCNHRSSVEDLLEDRVTCFALFAALGCVVCAVLTFWLLPVCLLVAYFVSGAAPKWLKRRKVKELKEACEGQMDVMGDILAMASRAGLSFDSSLKLFCEKFKTSLAVQMQSAQLQWLSGVKSRTSVLTELGERLGSDMFVRFEKTTTNAIEQGAPMANLLTQFAEDVRKTRSAKIEQDIEKAPVKMLIPMGTCILPAMLILVMGPVILQFVGAAL